MPPALFVAAWPPADVVDALAELPRPPEPGVRWVDVADLHVTLRYLGPVDPDEAASALAKVRARRAEAELGPVVSRLGRRVVCLPASGLDELAAAVRAATADLPVADDPRPFTGHLTLGRLGRRPACGLAGTPFRARFGVDEVVLASSTGGAGPRYDVLARRRLSVTS